MKTLSGTPMGEALAAPENATPAEIPRSQRSGKDRRVKDRRALDVQRKTHKTRMIRLAVLILSGATLILSTHFFLGVILESLEGEEKLTGGYPAIVVEIASVGTWRGQPKDLANFFATQDVLKENRNMPPEVRLNMIALKTDNLLSRQETLLKKVREMQWKEFERQAEFKSASSKPRQPSLSELENALRVAVIK